MYILKVTKTVPNENYEEELKEWKSGSTYGYSRNDREIPIPNLVSSVLTVEVTEEDWIEIKKGVLSIYK